jgi:crotonobetainyl-CoA:carnitine CoA-transferase CaiB-like acyl-CoA transferase
MSAMSSETLAASEAALGDIRVLELGSMLAGPFVGTLLADFGADVIKVEKPGKPDALREWPPHREGQPLWWKTMSRGKRLVTLDISRPGGRDVAMQMIARSDVVIENFKPGTMERWGLDPAGIQLKQPKLIWVRVSGFGQTGPYRERGGYATVAEGFAGLSSFTGFPDRGPMVSAFPLGDYLAGIFGAFGAMVALHRRERTGRGQVVDVSLYEPLLRIIESVVVRYDQTGKFKPRLGNQMEEDVPRNIYPTRDGGHVAISCGSQRVFENLLDAIGRADLKRDARFVTMADRVTHRDAIDSVVAGWMATQDRDEALNALERYQVVAGPIQTIAEVMEDPHVLAREAIAKLLDDELGPMRMPAPVPKLSETPGMVRWTGGRSGEHNEAVFEGLLGLSAAEIDRLAQAGVI